MCDYNICNNSYMKNHTALIFEGIDGAGKSTIVKRLYKEFKDKFYI